MKRIIDYFRMLFSFGILDFAGKVNNYFFREGDFYARGPRTMDKVGHLMKFTAVIYDGWYKEPVFDTQLNKLYGVSESRNRHKNSMRIGWQAGIQENTISLYAYFYVDGVRNWEYLTEVYIGEEIICSIQRTAMYWNVYVNNTTFSTLVRHSFKGNLRRLYPYFGGDVPSPKNITISINEL